jgi:ADP-heptose:LPS heptosyltransferase
VVLVAETDGATKQWGPAGWAALADRVRAAGAEVFQLTRDDPSPAMLATGIEAFPAPTPGDAVDVLGSCLAVVGVDTGMTHIAVQQGTPTVTLCRPRPVYFRPWSHCRAVVGVECDEACAAIEAEYAYNDRVSLVDFQWTPRSCPVDGRCLDHISPDRVAAALEELISEELTWTS